MRAVAIIAILLLPFTLSAQFYHEVYNDWTPGYSIGVFGRYQMASNAVTASLSNAIYTGSPLSREAREATLGLLRSSNRMGVDGDYGLFFRHLPDSAKGIGYFIRIADRYQAHTTFSDDLLNVGMFGNARFAGQTADMGPLTLQYHNYKQYEIGLLKVWEKPKTKWHLGVGLSFLTGNQAVVADFEEASLFTDADGEYLDIVLHGSLVTSSIASTQYFAGMGYGFSASVHVGMQGEKFGWTFQLDDLGMLSWGSRLREHDVDTVARFEGAAIDLFGDDPFVSVNLDTITKQLVTSRDGNGFVTPTAGSIRAEGSYRLNAKDWRIYLGVHHRFALGYFPLIYVGTSAPLPKRFYIDGRFAYGGFGSWNIGLELRKNFGGHVAVRMGTFNLEGYLLPNVATGQSAYVGLTGYF